MKTIWKWKTMKLNSTFITLFQHFYFPIFKKCLWYHSLSKQDKTNCFEIRMNIQIKQSVTWWQNAWNLLSNFVYIFLVSVSIIIKLKHLFYHRVSINKESVNCNTIFSPRTATKTYSLELCSKSFNFFFLQGEGSQPTSNGFKEYLKEVCLKFSDIYMYNFKLDN